MKLLIFMALTTLGAALVWPSVRPTAKQEPALEYLVRQPTIASEQPPLLIMLHGVGSNEQDLFNWPKSTRLTTKKCISADLVKGQLCRLAWG